MKVVSVKKKLGFLGFLTVILLALSIWKQQREKAAIEASLNLILKEQASFYKSQGISLKQEISEDGRFIFQIPVGKNGQIVSQWQEKQKEIASFSGNQTEFDLNFFTYDLKESDLEGVRQVSLVRVPYVLEELVYQPKQDYRESLLSLYLDEQANVFSLEDLIRDKEALKNQVRDKLLARGFLEDQLPGMLEPLLGDLSQTPWLIGAQGIQIDIQGLRPLELPYTELYEIIPGDLLKGEARVAYEVYLAEKEAARLAEEERLAQEAAARARGTNPVAVGKVIALTFDDGPHAQVTPQVLDQLKEAEVQATFFLLGQNIPGQEEVVKRMAAEGHQLANHTWSHPNLTKISAAQVGAQINQTQQVIFDTTGIRPTVLRPPYGSSNATVEAAAGLPIVNWTIDTLDWQHRNPQIILEKVKAQAQSGGVILMHDIHQTTADALPEVIAFLKKEGYQFVTVNEMYGY